jgi:sulfur-carrier protein adenylyltransferase/sulfurtransferase
VVDGSDNFPTRYLSSDVCVWAQKPNIYGSIFRFDGQATVFAPHLGGPCYRCLFPQPPPPGTVPSCAEAGVLGVLPGVIGTLQAIETVKLILGVGESLLGRLIHFDALKMRWREFKIRRDPQCPVCGDSPTITEPIDYEQFCSAGATAAAAADELSVHELKQLMDAGEPLLLIDVREPFEYELARIDGARLIPLQQLPRHVDELRAARRVVVHCHSGVRSGRAVDYLRQHGIEAAVNLAGGIDAWSVEIDPAVPRY